MPNIMPNTRRHDVVKLLAKPSGNVGVELGVAGGSFSARMVQSGAFDLFIGVDRYGGGVHGIEEYRTALKAVGLASAYRLLRMTFDEALELFDEGSLDFIYIDGYAHTGEEGGRTIHRWASKVRVGGVIAGDDYHSNWPLVVAAVDDFIRQTGFELNVTSEVENQGYSQYPSWAVVKTHDAPSAASSSLVRRGRWGALRRPFQMGIVNFGKSIALRVLSPKMVAVLKNRMRSGR